MAQIEDIDAAVVQLAKILFEGKTDDAVMFARRVLRVIGQKRPDLFEDVGKLMRLAEEIPTRSAAKFQAIPVDSESRLELLRREETVELSSVPAWPPIIAKQLDDVLRERKETLVLADAGLLPTRSLLFVGPPGVGKTLAARWLAHELGRPLLTLDLAAVMSSFLGKTGNNIRVVLDYAKRTPSILLLDEFDAIAKRRDDSGDVGELKRLVTVLLQSVDEWPPEGLLIAATNHPELLDTAIWRRFERVVEFPLPSRVDIEAFLRGTWRSIVGADEHPQVQALSSLFEGKSFADVATAITRARRQAVLEGDGAQELFATLVGDLRKSVSYDSRVNAARSLLQLGYSQRRVSEITGLARATIHKHSVMRTEKSGR